MFEEDSLLRTHTLAGGGGCCSSLGLHIWTEQVTWILTSPQQIKTTSRHDLALVIVNLGEVSLG